MARFLIVFDDQEVFEADSALEAMNAAALSDGDRFPLGGKFCAIDLGNVGELAVFTIGATVLESDKPRTVHA